MPSKRYYSETRSNRENTIDFVCGGDDLANIYALNARFSKLQIIGGKGTIPPKPDSHSSVVNGYGIWWEVRKGKDLSTSVGIDALSGRVPTNRRAGSTEREVWEKCNNHNLITHMKDGYKYLSFSFQQYYEDNYTSLNYVPGWIPENGYYIDLEYEIKQPTVTNFNIAHTGYVDHDVVVTWEADIQDRYSVVVNGYEFSEGQGTTNKRVVIPKNRLKIGDNIIYIKVSNVLSGNVGNLNGQSAITTTETKTIKLDTLKPTVSNVTLSNTGWLIDNNTTLTWQSTNQLAYRIKVNDKVVASGGDSKGSTIPGGSCIVGSNRIVVEIIKTAVPGVTDSERTVYYEVVKEYARIMPSIDTVTVSGLNLDFPTTVTWSGANFTEAQLYINGTLKGSYPVNVSQYTTLPGELIKGINEFKVIGVRRTAFDSVAAEKVITKTIIQDEPLIYSLEPNGVEIDREVTNTISFTTNTFCSRWELSINNQLAYSGDAERTLLAPANLFKVGVNTMTLTSYYSPTWSSQEVRTTSKTVTFTGYGKPNIVKQDATETYQTATPTFTWSYADNVNDKQTEYELKVMDGNTQVDYKKAIAADTSYKVVNALANNKTYQVMISIKNKFGKWSNWSTKTIKTSFNALPVPVITVNRVGVMQSISVSVGSVTNFKAISVFRKVNEEWVEIAYNLDKVDTITDYTCPANVSAQYKARLYDAAGGYSDSLVVTSTLKLINYHLTNLEGNDLQLDFVKLTESPVFNKVKKVFAGSSKPVVYSDQTAYKIYNLGITLFPDQKVNFEQFAYSGQVLCYRDYKGNKIYCDFELTNVTHEKGYSVYTATLTEVAFDETRMYKGSIPNDDGRAVVYAERIL